MVWYVKYCQYYVMYITILCIVPYYGSLQYNICTAIILSVCRLSILYCWFVDIVDLLQKWYPTTNHNEMNNNGDSRALRRIKNADNQRKRCQDPARREAEQVVNTAWRGTKRHQDPARREAEQVVNTAQWRTRREQPGVLEHKALQCTTAQEEPGRRDEENEQHHTRREQPGVLEHETVVRWCRPSVCKEFLPK